jgi:cytochrome c-type biogenesis protein CcmE
MTRKRRRLYFVLLGLAGIGAGVGLALTAFQDNIVFFRSPTEVAQGKVAPDQRFRIGGLVENGSLQKDGEKVAFTVTDTAASVKVTYIGLLPDLFREGQGIVAEGHMKDGVFVANEVLAKHDENYMPKEVADALKKSGHWQEGGAGTPPNEKAGAGTPPNEKAGAPSAATK